MRAVAVSAFLAAATLAAPPAAAAGPSDPRLEPHLVRDIGEPDLERVLHCIGICEFVFGSLPEEFVPVGERLYFVAGDELHGTSLWVTDGSETGTRRVPAEGWLSPIHPLGDRLLFLRMVGGSPLGVTDGTAAGTRDLPADVIGGYPLAAAAAGDTVWLLFSGSGAVWRTDGTPEGTREVAAATAGREMAVAGGRVFLVAAGGTSRLVELTPEGHLETRATACVPHSATEERSIRGLRAHAGDLYFFADCLLGVDDGAEVSLYRLAPGAGTLRHVADRAVPLQVPTRLGPAWSPPVVGGELYFRRRNAEGDEELWRSGPDGPVRATPPFDQRLRSIGSVDGRLVLDFWDAELHGLVDGRLVPLGVRAYAGLGLHPGSERVAGAPLVVRGPGLWQTDGTPEGTRPISTSTWAVTNELTEPTAIAGNRFYYTGGSVAPDDGVELWAVPLPSVHGCVEGPTRHCLADGRFAVSVTWRDPRSGNEGAGKVAGRTADSGFFWFFDRDNVELLVKVLDARAVDGRHWVFHGSLTDVAYSVRVEDLATGVVRTYERPAASLCGGADTAAFGPEAPAEVGASPAAAGPPARTPQPGAELHLGDGGRFAVEVEWLDPASGLYRPAAEVETSEDAGWAWFFDPANVEVFVKVLDATPVDGHHWVFHGGLTDLGYRVTVADRLSGAERVYVKAPGSLCGGADTAAF